ncbi:hypothetical protein H257_01814 [Aphanomyces astaci]|uniref:Uncharacterized protein n=1 Tax=Aphanomyces astaci TaxID=112090 RepID=W4H616_APHAT|nr:hypothetical protein H257_01814 [Aphanomyces astaci]ETV86714.1 hypothetical protein H257_01814 [Aphanomyces astaci]|eukprot:XP_009823513.1 hypothetical protein H257_01814 [Aphanomyces astaci]
MEQAGLDGISKCDGDLVQRLVPRLQAVHGLEFVRVGDTGAAEHAAGVHGLDERRGGGRDELQQLTPSAVVADLEFLHRCVEVALHDRMAVGRVEDVARSDVVTRGTLHDDLPRDLLDAKRDTNTRHVVLPHELHSWPRGRLHALQLEPEGFAHPRDIDGGLILVAHEERRATSLPM